MSFFAILGVHGFDSHALPPIIIQPILMQCKNPLEIAVFLLNMAVATDPKELAPLFRAIETYQGGLVAKCALKLLPLVFVRTGELRHMEWSEFDFDAAEWNIPGQKMKMKEPHLVPLSEQAIAILK